MTATVTHGREDGTERRDERDGVSTDGLKGDRQRAGELDGPVGSEPSPSALPEDLPRPAGGAPETHGFKDDFLVILSHELRTPLSAILGWVRVLRTTQPDRDTTDRALESIERNARAQTKLIDDLLDVSRIISGHLRLEIGPIDLEPLITAAVEATRPAADAKSLRLETAFDSSVGRIAGDPERLEQIVRNLVSNAVKFTPPGGSVRVRLERRGTAAEIVVSDTGLGIAPESLPCVFEPFRQADRSTARPPGGLGLGLAVAQRLAELHGGTIRADSPGIGYGATFTVSLPLGATSGEALGERGRRRPSRAQRRDLEA